MLKKTIVLSMALAVSAFAGTKEDRVLNFSKIQLEATGAEYTDLKVLNSRKHDGWDLVKISFKVKQEDKMVDVEEEILINGKYIVSDAINADSLNTLRSEANPEEGITDYNKERLIFGSHNAKNKIVVFSDPLCYYCKQEMAKLKKVAKKDIAIYLYHYPIEKLHPSSKYIIQNIIASGNKPETIYKIYEVNPEESLIKSTDQILINKWFNEITGEKVSLKQAEAAAKDSLKDRSLAEKLKIEGTPTIYVNGKKDRTRGMLAKIIQ